MPFEWGIALRRKTGAYTEMCNRGVVVIHELLRERIISIPTPTACYSAAARLSKREITAQAATRTARTEGPHRSARRFTVRTYVPRDDSFFRTRPANNKRCACTGAPRTVEMTRFRSATDACTARSTGNTYSTQHMRHVRTRTDS